MATALALKTAADGAVTAALAAIVDEEQSRDWLYCELGAVPTAQQWVNQAADFTAPADYWTAMSEATQQTSCAIPQVLGAKTSNAAGDEATCTAACQADANCAVSTWDAEASTCSF